MMTAQQGNLCLSWVRVNVALTSCDVDVSVVGWTVLCNCRMGLG